MKKLNINKEHFIGGYYIQNKICDKIVDYFNLNKKLYSVGEIGNFDKLGVNEDIKKSTEIVSHSNIFFDIFPEYGEELSKCINLYLKEYEYSNQVDKFNINEPVKIQFYKKNEGFKKWHFENIGNIFTIKRHLVFMTYLNDVDDGGTEFFYQKIKTPAKKGLTLIWPAGWTHTHRGEISKNKKKYIVTGWYSYY